MTEFVSNKCPYWWLISFVDNRRFTKSIIEFYLGRVSLVLFWSLRVYGLPYSAPMSWRRRRRRRRLSVQSCWPAWRVLSYNVVCLPPVDDAHLTPLSFCQWRCFRHMYSRFASKPGLVGDTFWRFWHLPCRWGFALQRQGQRQGGRYEIELCLAAGIPQ